MNDDIKTIPIYFYSFLTTIIGPAGRNNLYAKQGRVSANDYAKCARDLFDLYNSDYYNDSLANGKV